MPSRNFLMKASASTISAFDPPCVSPLQSDILQSGSQPSCLYVSIKDRTILVTSCGSIIVKKGNCERNESQRLLHVSAGQYEQHTNLPVERIKIRLTAPPQWVFACI